VNGPRWIGGVGDGPAHLADCGPQAAHHEPGPPTTARWPPL